MKRSGEIEPTGVFALLAGARCAPACADRPAAPTAAPRTDAALTVFTSVDEARAAVDTAAASARRLLSIYTPDLEPELYDQTAFLEVVKRFVLSRSFSKVRVLLADSARVVRDDNRFAAMGRRLTSCIDIRRVDGPRPQRACAYLIADDRAIVYRLRADTWDGIADLDNPPVARLYLAEFDELWGRSAPRDALRIARTRG